jgi:hypothetical protein
VTPESAEHGDYAESGWLDKEGQSMEPDRYDIEEGKSAVDNAVWYLNYKYVVPSSTHFHKGVWYSATSEPDFRTMKEETISFHLEDFNEEEQQEIFQRVSWYSKL